MTFSLAVGSTLNITVGNLSTRPSTCNFRPVLMSIESTTAYAPNASDFVPTAVQLIMLSPAGDIVASGSPTTLGMVPRRVFIRYPRSSDWWPYNNVASSHIARITCVCLGPSSSDATTVAYLRGVIHIRYLVSREILSGTCPTVHLSFEDPESEASSSFDMVDEC